MVALAVPVPRADDPTIDALTDACGTDPAFVCERVFDATGGNRSLAQLSDWLIDRPLSILLIIGITWAVSRLLRRSVDRLVQRVIAAPVNAGRWITMPGLSGSAAAQERGIDAERDARLAARRTARAASVSGVLRSTLAIAIWTLAMLLILGELGIDLAPLIAGAGIAGVALGFGAQSLVKDCISGLFMLMEDQYGIGDVVDLGEATGTVEDLRLRTTVLRGVDGTVWHVPNGEVRRVGNKSQHWSTALIDIDVAYDADLTAVREVIERTARVVCAQDDIASDILEEPVLLGVEMLGANGITLRMTVTTAPGAQWAVQRALREALKAGFDEAGIDIPFPQRTVWLRNSDS